MFKAILLSRNADKTTHAELTPLEDSQLPDRAVTVDVSHSTLNFKDALAITGQGAVVRSWPLVPGIDLAGTVAASSDAAWTPGEAVVVTGWGLGENHWGGLSQRQRVDAGWLLRIPAPFTARSAMAVGTAGFTASLGYAVVASTGRAHETAYLQGLGATRIIDRATLAAPGKPLQTETWAGVVDTVGSHTLVNVCAQTRFNGAVVACGLAQGGDFPATVMPFILRGVTLYGINSVFVANPLREAAWALMARHLDLAQLEAMVTEIGLSEAIAYAPRLLAGQVRGRTVVDTAR
ncbi:MAG: oxidoreductase [Burkholderiales bacterium PBB5]|nr:MAG: oxidoreductase [Burkholderiales bacterium PBB5]